MELLIRVPTFAATMMEDVIAYLAGPGRMVVIVHGNADMDAVGSAYAVSHSFPECDVFAPNGLDRVSRMVAEKMGMAILDDCDPSSYDRAVVVDTSSPEQLERDVLLPPGFAVIDHHRPTGRWDGVAGIFHCDDTRTSCCEIVKEILDAAGIAITRDVGLMLLGGMLTDSGHFQYARPSMLPAFADVMVRCGIEMDEAMDLTKAPVSMSERIAMMKAIERTRFDRVGEMIVAISFGGSFEASSCRAIMAAGADVVFVGSQRDECFRLSGRATQDAVRKGVHLGDIMSGVGQETMCDGGGHGGAAGLTGIGDVEAMLNICMSRTMDVFREIKRRDQLAAESDSGRS